MIISMNEEETVDVTVCSVYNKWLSVQKHMQKIEFLKIQGQKIFMWKICVLK